MDNIELYFKKFNELKLFVMLKANITPADRVTIVRKLEGMHMQVLKLLNNDPRLDNFYLKGIEQSGDHE